jgi:hypothetical protein
MVTPASLLLLLYVVPFFLDEASVWVQAAEFFIFCQTA